jgi:hypothetical protein
MTDDEFEESLKEWAAKTGADYDSILTYAIGTEDEEAEGHLYFCPRCGAFEEYGHEPNTRMMYRKAENGELKEAGYFTSNHIDCSNCNNIFEIHSDKYQETDSALNKLFTGDGDEATKH